MAGSYLRGSGCSVTNPSSRASSTSRRPSRRPWIRASGRWPWACGPTAGPWPASPAGSPCSSGSSALRAESPGWSWRSSPKAPAGTDAAHQLEHSFAGRAGHLIEPVIKPAGFDWRIGIGLISSFAAREVFVSSTAVVFSVENPEGGDGSSSPLRAALRDARWPDGRALFTPLVCLSLMIYYVFAMQCMSTIAVVRRETNSWRWPIFQTLYMTGTAWVLSFIVYQSGTALGF